MSEQPRLDLDAIETRCAAATPGPWECGIIENGGQLCVWYGDRVLVEGIDENAEFTAAAHQDVPALVAECRRLRTALEQVESADVSGWDDGGRLASRCQSIARAALGDQEATP
jgi:hypothetical protein